MARELDGGATPLRARIAGALVALALAAAAGGAAAGDVVATFSGSRNTTTASFEVDGPWLLEWRINSDYRMQSAFELNLIDGETGFFDSRILRTKRVGRGLKLFRETGKFRFEISANFTDWHLKVEQLTEEEAAAYRPVQR